jgi:LysR family hydrogen peroxide-inducible transcriptional activator
MAAKLDTSNRRLYRSLAGLKPTRKIVLVSNPYRFQSKISREFERIAREAFEAG